MVIAKDLKSSICSLFEVYAEEDGTQRVVTPLEFSGSNDRVVVRVRPLEDGSYQIDENGEAALYSTLNGGDIEAEAVARWCEDQAALSPATFDPNSEAIYAFANDERLIAPYVLRVAQAAQQFYTLSTSRLERQTNDFRERVKSIMEEIAADLSVEVDLDKTLPRSVSMTLLQVAKLI